MTNSVLGVRNIQHTNGTDAITIDTSGNTTANGIFNHGQPIGFCASKDGTLSISANNTRVSGWTVSTSTGMHGAFNADGSGGSMLNTSTGVVTIPVNGYYQINANVRLDSFGGTYAYFDIMATNSSGAFLSGNVDDRLGRTLMGNVSSNYEAFTYSVVGYYTASTHFALFYRNSGDDNVNIDGDTYFSCFKVG